MPLLTFQPPRPPNVIGGQDVQVTARTRIAQFNDGYSQRSGDGLNAMKQVVSLSWSNLRKQQADEILAFFRARGGYEAFFYAVPCLTEEVKWIAQGWKRTMVMSNNHTVSVTLEQVFDL